MTLEEKHLFELLKQKIATTFLQNNSASSNIEDWKGNDIISFQEDLFTKVKAKVSEKWFYTYIKNTPEKLPRIDILNLLSNYIDYKNWHAFKEDNSYIIKKQNNKKKYLLLLIVPFAFLIYSLYPNKNTFQFCFIDDIKNEAITNIKLDIKLLHDKESPTHLKTDSLGCFIYETPKEEIRFVVQSPYHKTDTIIRHINSSKNEVIKLKPDDYALMLHYYTNGKIKDWKKHKKQLESLISNDAKIYRLYKNSINIEIYSKAEFINMLTIPTNSLKRTEILDKALKDGKITTLKFIVR